MLKNIMLAATGAVLLHGAGHAAENLSVCIDSASATASRDQTVAEAVAKREGVALDVQHFNGGDDDDGVSPKQFKKMLSTKCQLVMGYPVDATDGFAPPGIMETASYDQTGFVLVVPKESPAKSLADLPKDTEVAVTFEAPPNLFFLHHPNVQPDVHENDAETLKTITDGTAKAAMVWQPTVQKYLDTTPTAKIAFYPLQEPHARYNVVALYTDTGADAAKRFDTEVQAMHANGGFDPAAVKKESTGGFDPAMVRKTAVDTPAGSAPPALYTAQQASDGASKFSADCSACHGAELQGISGPSLKGPNFASEKAGFAVGDVFAIVSQNMPASNPGSLDQGDYVQIMAFLLQQNGYPAGSTALTFASAGSSKVPLIYRGK